MQFYRRKSMYVEELCQIRYFILKMAENNTRIRRENIFRVATDRVSFDFLIYIHKQTNWETYVTYRDVIIKENSEKKNIKNKFCMTTLLSIFLHCYLTLFYSIMFFLIFKLSIECFSLLILLLVIK